jgi:ketosteroid isomerase-like protein
MGQMTLKDPKFHVEDVLVGGDLAVETGTYEWTVQPKKGKAMLDKGNYVTVWRRQPDGSWKIVRDISNSDRAGT